MAVSPQTGCILATGKLHVASEEHHCPKICTEMRAGTSPPWLPVKHRGPSPTDQLDPVVLLGVGPSLSIFESSPGDFKVWPKLRSTGLEKVPVK